jgi:shikimate kinase
MLIFLIGFSGAGKTTAGKRLAKALGMAFEDLDAMIEQETGITIPEIFAASGEAGFRKKESAVLKNCAAFQNTIIATGGGTPCFHDNISWMNRHGITVYLRMSAGSLYRRLLYAKTERPLTEGKSESELKEYVEKALADREKFYKKAQYTVKGEDLDTRSLASWIRERMAKLS